MRLLNVVDSQMIAQSHHARPWSSGRRGVWLKLAPLPRFRSGKLLNTAVPIIASCAGSAGPSVAAGLEMGTSRYELLGE